MFECIVLQFAIAYNIKTTEAYQIYRCENSTEFKYLNRPNEKFEGVYDIESNIFIITNERKGI